MFDRRVPGNRQSATEVSVPVGSFDSGINELTFEADRPVLVITAKSKLREIFFDRINAGLAMKLEKPSYVHVRLSGTNHIFTTGGAIATVTKHLQTNWRLFSGTPTR